MLTFSLNVPVLAPVLLVLILCIVLGIALALFGALAAAGSELVLGVAEAIAGGKSGVNGSGTRRPKGAILARTTFYFFICLGAIALSLFGYQGFAYLAAVFGGVAFGIASIKLFI